MLWPGRHVLAMILVAIGLCLALAFFALLAIPWYVHGSMAGEVGGLAPLYLCEGSPYGRIVVEVHYEESARPSEAALLHLQALLGHYTGKSVAVREYGDIGPDEVPAGIDPGNVTGFGNQVLARHAVDRTGWIGGDAVIYVLYVNASAPAPEAGKGNRVSGASYRGDSFVVFENNLLYGGEEKTVLAHETGHLLGLEHDDNQSCAMAGSFTRVHRGDYVEPPPDDYCESHRAQLADERHWLLSMANIPGRR